MSASRATAEARRVQAVDAGLRAFGDHGLTTAAINAVADEIGVSQPYIFRLFGSKRDFFLACMDELEAREVTAFSSVVAGPNVTFEDMGAAFRSLVGDGTLGDFTIQVVAVARKDPEVAQRYLHIVSSTLRAVHEQTGWGTEHLTQFLARGVLIVQLRALGIDVATMSSSDAIEALLVGDAPSAARPDRTVAKEDLE